MASPFRAPLLVAVPAALLISSAADALPDFPTCDQKCVTKLVPNPDPQTALSAAIDGDTVAVAGWNAEALYIWVRSAPGVWNQQATITAPHANEWFGVSVAIDGDTAIVGAYGHDNYRGGAYVFVRSGTTWSLQATLQAAGLMEQDWFGYSVAIKGDNALIGALQNNGGHGAAYVFTRSGTTWSEQQKLGPQQDGVFGSGVAIGERRAVVAGLPYSYVFARKGTHWSREFRVQTPTVIRDLVACALDGRTAVAANKILYRSDHGWAVQATVASGLSGGVSGDTAVIGLPGPLQGNAVPGKARVYHRDSGVWSEQAVLTPPESDIDGFGRFVGISGCTIMVANYPVGPSSSPFNHAFVFEPSNCAR